MKKGKVLLACVGVIAAVLFVGTAPAYSSGYPVLGLYMPGGSDNLSAVVVGKFDSSDFTLQEVDTYAQSLPLVLGMFGGSLPGITVYGPGQLAQIGSAFADADYLKDYIKGIYQGVVDFYVFLDITKANNSYGPIVRIDALLDTTDGYLYVGSLEVPVAYFQLLTAF
ncbi:MAG: hypothetical protein P8013_10160 [Candidatus Sulfobium sp.]